MTRIDGEHDKISSAKLITVGRGKVARGGREEKKKIKPATNKKRRPCAVDGARANASDMFIAHRAKPRRYDSTGVLGIATVKEKRLHTVK